MSMIPKKARREKQKALIGLIGPSGGGKTLGGLRIAYGMMKEAYPNLSEEELWEKIGVIDTEHNRAMLYVGQSFNEIRIGEFLHIDFQPPFSTERYLEAVKAMKSAGVEVVIIDSLSHNWNGEGGTLDVHGKVSGNSFQNWNKVNGLVTDMVKALTSNDIHILATLRTKTEYVVEQTPEGKSVPKKVGTKPVQKDDMEYEFTTNFLIGADHVATVTKDNTNLFVDGEVRLTEEVGSKLYKWLELGVDIKAEERAAQEQEENERQALIKAIRELESASEARQAKVKEFEFKAKAKVEQFNLKLLERAKALLETIDAPATEAAQTN